jgi:hypothetical protein
LLVIRVEIDNFPVNEGKMQDAWQVPEEAKKEGGDRDAI